MTRPTDRARALLRRSLADGAHRLGLTRIANLDAERSAANELAAEIDLLRRADRWPAAAVPSHAGVNVVGYLLHQLSLGDSGRRLVDVLRNGGVPTSAIAYGLVPAEPVIDRRPVDQFLAYDSTIALLPADQIALLGRLHPEVRATSDHLVGYCYWELDTLSDAVRRGTAAVDEIWVHTRFIEESFANGTTKPVRRVPLPVAEPVSSGRTREEFTALAPFGDRPLIGVTFDYFSVRERKNPLGAVEAFARAFRPNEGPVLVVKTLHGSRFPEQHAELLARTAPRDDVVVWDEQLTRSDQMAFLAALDGLLSLHRSEGLGVHLAEAMWLGTPVVATGYSGNVDFMDDENSLLVGFSLTEVRDGGGIYPTGARWAEPDLDHAAECLRRLVTDAELSASLASRARSTMRSQPADPEVASAIAKRLGLTVGS
jgi:glycosyltransferase involved in cell wall biosynthesis